MSMSVKRRMRAGVFGLAVLVGVAVVPSVGVTEARFTDTEHASSSTFTAQTLPAPVITACTVQSLSVIGIGLVFQSVTISWTSTLPPANVRLTATSGAATGTVPSANITASGPVGGVYTYSATLNQALLTSLVTNLLGSTTTLTATNYLPGTAWVSAGASRKLTIALLGLNATCTV